MITYLKNMKGWKHKDLKSKDFDSIKELFDKAFKRVNMFVDFRTYLVEGSSKRAGKELEQESTKKQKVDEKKRHNRASKIFSQMIKSFDREDLEDLHKFVKARYGSSRPVEDLDLGRIVGIKSFLMLFGVNAAFIDVNAAQSKLVLLENFNENYSKCNSQVKDNKIDLLVKQYEQFVISEDEYIDSAFARFNTIITSLKALDEGYSGKNYVRKFLRDLHPKWRAKVTAIEESKDLTSLSLDELIGNLKVREIIIKKDSEIVKAKGERKYLALKAKKESSDEEVFDLRREVKTKNDKNGKSERKCFRCGDPNHLIGECLKPPKDKNQRAFIKSSWSDSGEEDDEKAKDEMCLVAQASNEICLGVDLKPDE
ncbi:zf-CCHC domain-containing protein [Tanacetum coccineum]